MKLDNVVITVALLAGGILGYRLLRNTTNLANRTTNTLDNSKTQAAKFYALFGITKVGGVPIATPILRQETWNNLIRLSMNVDDWRVIQSTFTDMCGGNYAIFQAATNSLNTTEYGIWADTINAALSKKRIFCVTPHASLLNADRYGGIAAENFNAGDFVGRCQSEDDLYYYYVSILDGVTYACDKKFFELM